MHDMIKLQHLLHGADYNPEQWLKYPEILSEDLRLMALAGVNVVSVGIFSWASIEPEQGRYTFDWLDCVMDGLHSIGVKAFLATPSSQRPNWVSDKYPEVFRMDERRVRNLHGMRACSCFTSPVYRQLVANINRKLAERYAKHPALMLWHISNEYGLDCHCPLCQSAFQSWLKERYDHNLEKLNDAWWTPFWSHTYTDWRQIESPSPQGEFGSQALALDWKRFVTKQMVSFMKNEIAAVREFSRDVPVTTNLMGTFGGLDYWKFAPEVDVISWDSYPQWHGRGEFDRSGPFGASNYNRDTEGRDWALAADVAFVHDLMRSLKDGQPFLLMESTPSVNCSWVQKQKRPGMHLLSSLQAIAHGSDSVMYFQWRKGRGGIEKFHGAVIDHFASTENRTFRDVAEVGQALKMLAPAAGTRIDAEVAILYDWENRWGIDAACDPRRDGKTDYEQTVRNHYRPFWRMGIACDIVNEDADFAKYKLLVAPMLYMVRPGVGERIEAFVRNGGVLVATYWSGIADESDLCFLNGFPGPLRQTLGLRSEELDALYEGDQNAIVIQPNNPLGLAGEYPARLFCDVIHPEGAETLANYRDDYYAGRAALTCNRFGVGLAYYIAAQSDERFHLDFYSALARELHLKRALETEIPEGVSITRRSDGESDFIFVMNFKPITQSLKLPQPCRNLLGESVVDGTLILGAYGVSVLTTGRE